jgi:peptidoglycan/xylan/chitin deacetylase (PgdA/CDA1 family)
VIAEIAAGTAAAGAGGWLHGSLAPNSPLFGPVTGRGPRDHSVYLTFDDGPNPYTTERIVRLLERERVPATFFMVGDHVRRFGDAARQVAGAGYAIGNHTETHRRLWLAGPARTQWELAAAHHAIAEATGVTPRSFRAPHGYRNPHLRTAARGLGYRVFGWTFGVWDTDRPGSSVIRRRVAQRLCPGAIVLLHDGDGSDPLGDRSQTAEALPGIIDDARARGYRFRALDELAG